MLKQNHRSFDMVGAVMVFLLKQKIDHAFDYSSCITSAAK